MLLSKSPTANAKTREGEVFNCTISKIALSVYTNQIKINFQVSKHFVDTIPIVPGILKTKGRSQPGKLILATGECATVFSIISKMATDNVL